jgi:hypothetical protein
MTSEVKSRGKAVQPHYGRTQANRLGSLPTGISAWINGTEVVNDTYGRLETEEERKAFFDEFLKVQRAGFSSAWVAIYQTVDLIRQNDWYWKSEGFESFEAFWREQGEALFGRWAELEATYQYAHLAAPHLFEVQYEEAKALAQQLAPFRQVPAANPADHRPGRPKKIADSDPQLIEPGHYVKEMNSPDWNEGFLQGQRAKADGGTSRFVRFARLRRDSPEVADRFLAGEFVKRFKNGTVQADMVAAEVAAGIRQEGQPVRQRDPAAYCKQLADKLTTAQLQDLQAHITHLLEIKQ